MKKQNENIKMDERHWWIATKIQETFRVNDIDRYVVVCSFICFTPFVYELDIEILDCKVLSGDILCK